jgi:hypothetical protein
VRHHEWIVPSTVSLCRHCGSEPIGSFAGSANVSYLPTG